MTTTPDVIALQERVRDLSASRHARDSQMMTTGWSQVVALDSALHTTSFVTIDKFPAGFREIIKSIYDECFEDEDFHVNWWNNRMITLDLNRNVRTLTKAFLKWPLGLNEFPPWELNPEFHVPLERYKAVLDGSIHTFKVVGEGAGRRLYLTLPSDALATLIEEGATNNPEAGHITVVNSNVFKPDIHCPLDGKLVYVTYSEMISSTSLDYPPIKRFVAVRAVCSEASQISPGQSLHWTAWTETRPGPKAE